VGDADGRNGAEIDAEIGAETEPEVDLEYDLAHEWTCGPDDAVTRRDRPAVYVATETTDEGGDYGYDMAHDVPGR
jgi:hypothetical protein